MFAQEPVLCSWSTSMVRESIWLVYIYIYQRSARESYDVASKKKMSQYKVNIKWERENKEKKDNSIQVYSHNTQLYRKWLFTFFFSVRKHSVVRQWVHQSNVLMVLIYSCNIIYTCYVVKVIYSVKQMQQTC